MNAKPMFTARALSEPAEAVGAADQDDLKARQQQEVAKIKHEHYQIRRLRKLSQLVKAAEKMALEKRRERERADMEYE